MNTTRIEPPLRVWLYRGWCWLCRRCYPNPGSGLQSTMPANDLGLGYGFPDQPSALAAALRHRHIDVFGEDDPPAVS